MLVILILCVTCLIVSLVMHFPLCLVFDSYVIDAGSLRTDLRYLSLVAIEIAAKMTDWSSRTRLKILE